MLRRTVLWGRERFFIGYYIKKRLHGGDLDGNAASKKKPHVAVRQNADSVSRATKRKYGVESQATHAPNKTIGTVVLCSKYKDL